MELSDGNSQITRKKASGWGNAIWEEEYSEGTVKITFKVDSDGGSDYWYIGVYQVAQEYDLSEYIGCDCPQEVWSWKRNGEVHRKGWSKDGLTGFKEYDEIAMLIDCNLRELTFFCDGNEVFKFVGIASSVIPVVCFGGLNQVLTVLKVERMSGSRPIHERALDVIGDSVYYWIPVNSGANIKHVWDSSQSGVTINSTKLSLSKTSNGKSNHVCEAELRFGKYYVEISIDSRGKVGLGFTKKSLIIDNTVEESPDSVIYYSNGDVKGKSVSSFDQGDIIGSYIDFEKNEVTFYKNGEAVETTKIELNLENSEDSYKFIAILHQVNQDLKIQNTGKYPEGIDLVTIDSEQEADKWGYKFTLIPNFKGRNLQLINSYLTFASAEDGVNWRENYQPIYSSFFKDKTADSLTKFIDSLTDQVAVTSMDQD